MHFQPAGAFRATVAENLVWPPAFKIAAAPNCHMLDVGKFQDAIHPCAAGPFWRAHIPIRMIIKRNEYHWSGYAAQSKRRQMMKVTGAVKHKRRGHMRLVVTIKSFYQARWRREA